MAAQAMKVPGDHDDAARAELMICVPTDWPLEQADFRDERNYWPLRWLKTIARLPHELGTWLWTGHTVATDDPPAPVAEGVGFEGFLVCESEFLPEAGRVVHLREDVDAKLLTLMPLYGSEMEFKLQEGVEALLERFKAHGIDHVVNVGRPNVCA
jgi:hypothetical protein